MMTDDRLATVYYNFKVDGFEEGNTVIEPLVEAKQHVARLPCTYEKGTQSR